jgi:superfamily II DNA or RNA helicase
MKALGMWCWRQRDWQIAGHDKVNEKKKTGKKNFLCEGTPGAGKTRFAAREIHSFLFLHDAQRVVISVPTENLKRQWAAAAHMFGIELDPNFDTSQGMESNEFHGIVVTYAQIGNNPAVFANACKIKKTIYVGDEIHHCGESKTWGEGILLGFEQAVFQLLLSGTPFRQDQNPIPFVEYDENGVSKADYRYSYEQAVIDKVCRMVYFPAYNGLMQWRVDDKEFKHTFDDMLKTARSSERLKTALDPGGDFIKHILRDADNKLDEIREKEQHTDAGGLITAIDQDHARDIRNVLVRITGEEPMIVISDDKAASKSYISYREGSSKWLISVKMVSEGSDIPRLRVGVYLTNVKTELYFRQFVGRFVRMLQHLEAQDAFVFIPKDPDILNFAAQIEVEREHALKNCEKGNGGSDGEEFKEGAGNGKPVKNFEAIASEVTETTQLEMAFSDNVARMFNLPGMMAKKITLNTNIQTSIQELPLFEQKKILRDEISELAKLYAKKKANGHVDWEIGHKDWIKQGGKKIDDETVYQLRKRIEWLKNNL